MSPSSPRVARLVTVASVTAGLGLIGASAGGIVAMDSELQAATRAPVPTRLVGEAPAAEARDDWRCRRPEAARPPYSPEV